MLPADPGQEGPILADFLAVGAATFAAGAPAVLPREQPAASAPREETEEQADPTPQERRVVVAALRRGEPLAQEQREAPARTPVSGVPMRSMQVPQFFAEGYAGYLESHGKAAAAGRDPPKEDAAKTATGGTRLWVLSWHRSALQKMVCRAILFQFLQDRREAMGLPPGKRALWSWEARAAQEFSAAGQVEVLVKYLVETELHIKRGPERSARQPGSPMPEGTAQRLRAERQRLARTWGVSEHRLEEDAVVRVFLDGLLSWSTVRNLLHAGPDAGQPAGARPWHQRPRD